MADVRRSRWPRIHWRTVGVVGLGGVTGGLARYGIGLAWTSASGTFPWAIFVVNTSGTFALAALLVVAMEVLRPTTYLRPALGTGFCGAYTTFSSVVVATDQLTSHGHAVTAAAYVSSSVVAGLVAATLGIALGRSAAERRKKRTER